MTNEVVLRNFSSGDEQGIIKLLQIGFQRWPYFDINCRPIDYWKWKYFDNPLKNSIINLVESDGQIVGISHSLLLTIKVGGESILFSNLGDTVVHPDFRGRGLMHSLRLHQNDDMHLKDIQMCYFTTTNPLVVKSLSKRYSTFPYQINSLVRINDVTLHLHKMPRDNTWIARLGYQVASIMSKVQNKAEYSQISSDCVVSQIDSFDSRADAFWQRVSPHYNFIVERTREVLNWRYCDKRAGNFVVLQAAEAEDMLGYLVLRVINQDPTYLRGHIVDLLTVPDRLDAANALVKRAVEFCDESEVNIIECKFVKNHPYVDVVTSNGFIDSRKETHVLHYPVIGEDLILKKKNVNPDTIHFTYSDM